MRADTINAFIFSLKNSEGLPPFKCFAKNKDGAIYKSSNFGPSFGIRPFLFIGRISKRSRACIGSPYSVPSEVKNEQTVLAGTPQTFYPDNYEVFYLA